MLSPTFKNRQLNQQFAATHLIERLTQLEDESTRMQLSLKLKEGALTQIVGWESAVRFLITKARAAGSQTSEDVHEAAGGNGEQDAQKTEGGGVSLLRGQPCQRCIA